MVILYYRIIIFYAIEYAIYNVELFIIQNNIEYFIYITFIITD